jgi:hypothetical protein
MNLIYAQSIYFGVVTVPERSIAKLLYAYAPLIAFAVVGIVYVYTSMIFYRRSGAIMKAVIALVIHPLISDAGLTIMKLHVGFALKRHPFYDHISTTPCEAIFSLLRRFMFTNASDSSTTLVLVVLSGFQEVVSRSLTEKKDSFFRNLFGLQPLTKTELEAKRKFWSYTVTMTSFIELSCIIVSNVMMVCFSIHRYAVDLGFSGSDEIDITSVVAIAVVQLVIEVITDLCCTLIEHSRGIPVSDFFFQFRNKEILFIHFSSMCIAFHWILHNMRTIPNALLCDDETDPCSCSSFSLYQRLCQNMTLVSNSSLTGDIDYIEGMYPVSSGESISISFIILAIVSVSGLGFLAYIFISSSRKRKALEDAQNAIAVAEEQRRKLLSDVTSQRYTELSSLHQAIVSIESLARGVSSHQKKAMMKVIEILKSTQTNRINIRGVLTSSSTNEATLEWLEDQLTGYDTVGKSGEAASRQVGSPFIFVHRGSLIPSHTTTDSTSRTGNDIEEYMKWDFDVFAIKEENPASWLVWKSLSLLSVIDQLKIPKVQLQNMLLYVEDNYSMIDYDSYLGYVGVASSLIPSSSSSMEDGDKMIETVSGIASGQASGNSGNPYHNNLHGADVFQAVMYLTMKYQDIGGDFTPLDLFSVLFGAYIHDFNHPGVNTTYVIADWPASGISTTFGTEVSSKLCIK